MGRRLERYEQKREVVEGELGRLGNALALLDLVKRWLWPQEVTEIDRAERLIRGVQDTIRAEFEDNDED